MKPILFSTPMVQAILAGNKTQTRRVIKNPPHCPIHGADPIFKYGRLRCKSCDKLEIKPGYQVGDCLYVREKWSTMCRNQFGAMELTDLAYAASDVWSGRVWKPSIHMPKEAARLFLRVTDIRAERLQNLSNDDAKAEGMSDIPNCARGYKANYMLMWDELYKNSGFGWESNPWVWVYEFEQISKDEAGGKSDE
jgi:hypothetical protein